MTARYIIGDTHAVTATLPDGSIDLVLTSPPFLALRSYLPADHPSKALEIGSEPDPATFLDVLLGLTAEWGRVLAPHGSICIELGDTYSGSGGGGGDLIAGSGTPNPKKLANAGAYKVVRHAGGGSWPRAKSLCGIPHLYHMSLAYGRNLLTGEESPAGQWIIRNVVAWCRPNPTVGALGDKFRPATSYLTIATRSRTRYFDLDAVRDRSKTPNTTPRAGKKEIANPDRGTNSQGTGDNPAGAPPLDYWVIPPAPYAGSHYAVYPPALCEKPIESMTPRKVCTVCGEPSRRIVESRRFDADGNTVTGNFNASNYVPGEGYIGSQGALSSADGSAVGTSRTTTGWTDCGHDSWRNGVVLDPFAGSGTTLMVASGHGRDSIGIDLDERNAQLALDRVGPLLLTVEHHTEQATA